MIVDDNSDVATVREDDIIIFLKSGDTSWCAYMRLRRLGNLACLLHLINKDCVPCVYRF